MTITLIWDDAMTALRSMANESVDCVVTSPPYWGLRDYGVAGAIGLEPSLGEHLNALVTVFREVRRVLKTSGTCWINYGDAYASAPNGRSAADTKAAGNDDRTFRDKPISTVGPIFHADAESGDRRGRVRAGGTLKPKDRMMLPARLAIALQEDGWWLRDEIVWHKPNPMPSSVKDRTTSAHEMIYMFSKAPKYFYDQEAIREPLKASSIARLTQPTIQTQQGGERQDAYEAGLPGQKHKSRRPNEIAQSLARKLNKNEQSNLRQYNGFNERWLALKLTPAGWARGTGSHGTVHQDGREEISRGRRENGYWSQADLSGGRNKRSVWTVAPKPFKEAHFATFPPDLITPCILAGCPEHVCSNCGKPWRRIVEKGEPLREWQQACGSDAEGRYDGQAQKDYSSARAQNASDVKRRILAGMVERRTLGFESACTCNAESRPGTVLDLFGGAGTTALVAERHGRNSILIELNPDYCRIARRRLGLPPLPAESLFHLLTTPFDVPSESTECGMSANGLLQALGLE